MKTLWESGPGNVQGVQEKLPGERPAYTTVQTMLNILQRKGKVKRRLVGKTYEYRAVLSREKLYARLWVTCSIACLEDLSRTC
jgi:predicted transcriptional regulator